MRPITAVPDIKWTPKNPQVPPHPILQLSDDVLQLVFDRLSMRDVGRAALACKQLLAKTVQLIDTNITNCPYNRHLAKGTTPKELLSRIKAPLPFMYTNILMKDVVSSQLLHKTSADIWSALRANDGEPLTRANALLLDRNTTWDLLNPGNCSNITHIELIVNWLYENVTNDIFDKIRTYFPNLISCSFKLVDTLGFYRTPLHVLCKNGLTQLAQLAIASGADVHAKTNNDETPLHLAAHWGRAKTVTALITAGADVHAKNKYGGTPLHRAAWCRGKETAIALITAGADVNAKDNNGDTPRDLAIMSENAETVRVLDEEALLRE